MVELAEQWGIEREYTDAHGEKRQISQDTERAVLHALGVDVSSDSAIQAALESEERRSWMRALPGVWVIRQGRDESQVEIVVPEDLTACRWDLDLEDGGHLGGEVSFEALTLLDSREVEGVGMQRRGLILPTDLPLGYHVLRIDCAVSNCRLIVCPTECWLPQIGPDEPRLWGIAAQLYLVRSDHNWGIGDFSDLHDLMTGATDRDVVGVNPLHALFPDDPERASPYSPSSRLLLNALYLDVASIEGFDALPAVREHVEQKAFQEELASCRSADLVQYARIAKLKWPVLRLLFAHAKQDPAFEAFRAEQGETLRLGCLFQALREHFARLDRSKADWRQWPKEFQDPDSTSVAAFAESNADEISFFAWLQWQADRQLARASEANPRARVGLYRDLAVGTDPAGAECWSNQALMLHGVHVGAPPDLFQAEGQDWGLAPFHPRKLQEARYEPFVALLRANMRHAGALRLDHAMSLERLYWIPEGSDPREGAYVRYPVHDLLSIVALESQRNRCIVIGEDLGTVKPEFREQMRDVGILSYRVLSFERAEDGSFLPAEAYPKLALAVAGNHDLPTLRGWWDSLNDRDRALLLSVLGGGAEDVGSVTVEEVIERVHAFLRRTPCLLAMAQLDDLEGEVEPVNVPGAAEGYPNWRRRTGRK